MKSRPTSKPARTPRKRSSSAEEGVATAQTVYAKFVERADPAAELRKSGKR